MPIQLTLWGTLIPAKIYDHGSYWSCLLWDGWYSGTGSTREAAIKSAILALEVESGRLG